MNDDDQMMLPFADAVHSPTYFGEYSSYSSGHGLHTPSENKVYMPKVDAYIDIASLTKALSGHLREMLEEFREQIMQQVSDEVSRIEKALIDSLDRP